jgi:hypothetical protein
MYKGGVASNGIMFIPSFIKNLSVPELSRGRGIDMIL